MLFLKKWGKTAWYQVATKIWHLKYVNYIVKGVMFNSKYPNFPSTHLLQTFKQICSPSTAGI